MNYGITDIMSLLGSLGLFLYGMKVMSDNLIEIAGDRMRQILSSITANRFFAVLTGFFITAVIQSSSATTLMVIGFVNASLLTLTEAVGVILGANIGTTVTAWLIAILGFKVELGLLALPLVFVGFLMIFSKRSGWKYWGGFLIGFAVLFIGLDFLKASIPDIRNNPEILEFLTDYTGYGFGSVMLFLGIGTVLTVVVQSSSAAMALTLLMCHEGWIPFDLAAAMVLGQNIGTTVTANLAAIVADFNAKRAAMAHLFVNIVGVVLVMVVFYPYLELLDRMMLAFGALSAFDNPSALPVALSAFHTSFNVMVMLLLIGFIPAIVRLVTFLVADRTEEDETVQIEKPKYLTAASLAYPQTGIRALMDETRRLFEHVIYKLLVHGLHVHRSDIETDRRMQEIIGNNREMIHVDFDAIYYRKVKVIYSEIVSYAVQLQSQCRMDTEKIELIRRILVTNRNIVEVVKKMKEVNRNLTRFMRSDNRYVRDEYDQIRSRILKVVRWIYRIARSDQPGELTQTLEDQWEKARRMDVLMSGRIDDLIREDRITKEMATSLMNDSAAAVEICRHLISHAELIYGEYEIAPREAEEKGEAVPTAAADG